jgi:hypothetical protein
MRSRPAAQKTPVRRIRPPRVRRRCGCSHVATTPAANCARAWSNAATRPTTWTPSSNACDRRSGWTTGAWPSARTNRQPHQAPGPASHQARTGARGLDADAIREAIADLPRERSDAIDRFLARKRVSADPSPDDTAATLQQLLRRGFDAGEILKRSRSAVLNLTRARWVPWRFLMRANDIRRSFLDYFARNGHRIVRSSSLVPGDDPTLLFTNAGMNQFKDLFLGKERREYKRATTSQKCMRVSGKHNDLDNVGPSLRHHTFFEMLGNFSFGDYFKKDALPFAWELLTTVWGSIRIALPHHLQGRVRHPARRRGVRDLERVRAASGSPSSGLAENFWQMGDTGPCGRCSEIHYFRGNDIPARNRCAVASSAVAALRRDLEQRVHGVRPRRRAR